MLSIAYFIAELTTFVLETTNPTHKNPILLPTTYSLVLSVWQRSEPVVMTTQINLSSFFELLPTFPARPSIPTSRIIATLRLRSWLSVPERQRRNLDPCQMWSLRNVPKRRWRGGSIGCRDYLCRLGQGKYGGM